MVSQTENYAGSAVRNKFLRLIVKLLFRAALTRVTGAEVCQFSGNDT